VRKQQAAAKRMPSAEAGFRNLILNQRVSQTSTLIPRTVWKACDAAPDDDVFRRMPCYIALDLSARNDLTALVLIARDEEGVWHVRPEFYAPAAGLSERAHRDRVPYDVWRDMGFLIVTPGASVQYEPIAERLCELCDDFNVAQIGFDRWRIDVLQSELARIGRTLPMAPFGQGFKDMSPAIDALEAELLNVKIRHGSHPVLNWNANNAIVVKDSAGNRKLDKSKVTGRIDGIVALAMALGIAGKAEQPLVMPDDYELLVA
jgi:phage terminase large subunit-like protein